MTEKPQAKTNVTVCVRCRKLLPSEILAGNSAAVHVNQAGKEVSIGSNKVWKFDDVFDEAASQETVYGTVVKDLVQGCFSGINATVLACQWLLMNWRILFTCCIGAMLMQCLGDVQTDKLEAAKRIQWALLRSVDVLLNACPKWA